MGHSSTCKEISCLAYKHDLLSFPRTASICFACHIPAVLSSALMIPIKLGCHFHCFGAFLVSKNHPQQLGIHSFLSFAAAHPLSSILDCLYHVVKFPRTFKVFMVLGTCLKIQKDNKSLNTFEQGKSDNPHAPNIIFRKEEERFHSSSLGVSKSVKGWGIARNFFAVLSH